MGVELSYWLSTDVGPVLVKMTEQAAICFVRRSLSTNLQGVCERKPLALRALDGEEVDGLYFKTQRALDTARESLEFLESDIRPDNRFLMERFVTASLRVHGDYVQHKNHREYLNPRISATEYRPSLLAASLDIETNGFTNDLYSIAVSSAKESIVMMVGVGQDSNATGNGADDYSLHYLPDEAALLKAFLLWFRALDPDLIIGWNLIGFDLWLLQEKCRKHKLRFSLGRTEKPAHIMQRDNSRGAFAAPARALVPGRAVLDGIDLLKAGFWSFESFALDNVAHELLGIGKTITSTGKDKVREINRQFREDKAALARYNIQDCQLVEAIFEHAKLFDFAVTRAQLTGLAIDRLGGSVATFDNLYLPKLHREGYVANDVDTNRGSGLGSPGGYVLDSEPGLFRNVLVLDFKSLYPSIIRSFLIDPLGLATSALDSAPVPGYEGAQFNRTSSILPDLIGDLWAQRDAAKLSNDDALSQAIKIIMNSFYGVLGTSACRFYDKKLASSITRRGHMIITESRELIDGESQRVIYGDTDSLFVLIDASLNEQQAAQIGQAIAARLNEYWTRRLRDDFQLQSHLEIEFETHYLRFLMPTIRGETTGSKKRYAGLIRNKVGELDVQIKGLEAARSDWTSMAKDFQRDLFFRIFTDQDYTDLVKDTVAKLKAGELDDQLIYKKRLRRPLEDYQKNVPPHVQAARKLEQHGRDIRYVITVNGPEPVEAMSSRPDYDHYLERQLSPAGDSILTFMNTSVADISSDQFTLF